MEFINQVLWFIGVTPLIDMLQNWQWTPAFYLQNVLPMALAFLIVGVGMSTTPANFRYVLERPKLVAVAMSAQVLLWPLLVVIIIKLFGLTGTAAAAGLLVLALSPAGSTGMVFTNMAKANLELAASITLLSGLLVPFTFVAAYTVLMPVVAADLYVQIDFKPFDAVIDLMRMSFLPLALGMFIRWKFVGFVMKIRKPYFYTSLTILVWAIYLVASTQWHNLEPVLGSLGVICVVLNVALLILSFTLSKWLTKNDNDAFAISMESTIQNGTMSLFIITVLIQNAAMAVPVVLYSLSMFSVAFLAVIAFRMSKRMAVVS